MAEPWPNPWASLAQGFAGGLERGQQMSLLRRQQETQERQQKLAGAMNSMKNGMELLAAKNPATRKIGFELIRQVAKNNPELGYNLDNINLDENQITHDAVTEFAKNSLESMKLFEGGKLQPQDLDKTLRESYGRAFEELRKADDEDSIKRMDKIMESRRGGAAGKLASDITFYQPYSSERGAGSPAAAQGVKDFQQGLLSSMSLFDPEAAQKKENAMLRGDTEEGIRERSLMPGTSPVGTIDVGGVKHTLILEPRTGKYTAVPIPGGELPGPKAAATTGAGDVSALADQKVLYDRLGDIKQAFSNPKMKGRVGPLEGRWSKIKVMFKNDGITQKLVNEIESTITLAYSLSGKQITEKEIKMLKQAILPRLEQPEENLVTTLDFARDYLKKTHNERVKYLRAGGHYVDAPELGEQPAPAGAIGDGKNNDPLGIR